MSIETDLYTTLSNDAGVTAICSTRIYPGMAPESVTLPYITYQMVSGERIDTVTGVGDMTRKRIQINCNADTYAIAKSLSAAVIAALEGDGYLELEYELYNSQTQIYMLTVDWSFLAP